VSKIVRGSDPDASRRHLPLTSFSHIVQDYGTYFSGFDWQIYGCGTYRDRAAIHSVHSSFSKFHLLLAKHFRAPIATIAVPEDRDSGNGKPAIRPHWHFVMAGPPQYSEALLTTARLFWTSLFGNAHIQPYDPALAGCHYLAKTAATGSLDFIIRNLDRMPYRGPMDIIKDSMTNPNVPDHVRDRSALETLRVPARLRRLTTIA